MNLQSIISKTKRFFEKYDVNSYESYPISIRESFDFTLSGNWGMRIDDKGGTMVTFFATNRDCSFGYMYKDDDGAEVTVQNRPYDDHPIISPPPAVPDPPPEIILVSNKIIFRFMKVRIPYFHKDGPRVVSRP